MQVVQSDSTLPPVADRTVPTKQGVSEAEPVGQKLPAGQILPVVPSVGLFTVAALMQIYPSKHVFVMSIADIVVKSQ